MANPAALAMLVIGVLIGILFIEEKTMNDKYIIIGIEHAEDGEPVPFVITWQHGPAHVMSKSLAEREVDRLTNARPQRVHQATIVQVELP